MAIQDSYTEVFNGIEKVLIVMAHPDDFEINCGGLAARLANDNKQLRLVVTTNGEKGMQGRTDIFTEDFANERLQEQIKAAQIIGIPKDQVFNLNIPDGELENTYENIGDLAKHIREFKPDLIITHNAQDFVIEFSPETHWVNHRDHRNTGSITLDAMYPYSRDRGFFPEHFEDGLEPWEVSKVLIADSYTATDKKYFEITNFIDYKAKGIAAHKSAISEEHVKDYIDETLIEGKNYEMFRFLEIY